VAGRGAISPVATTAAAMSNRDRILTPAA
jgi:hypothetical protein